MPLVPASDAEGRPEYVTLIAIYQFVTAGILFLLSCLVAATAIPFILYASPAPEGAFTAVFTATVALGLFLGFGVASVIVGWGLLRMRRWARLGALVLAGFGLIGFPIWTIVSVLVLVYLTSDEGRSAFGEYRAADSLAAERPQAAAYKKEPPPPARPGATEETRRMTYPATGGRMTGGDGGNTAPSEETRRIDEPIPMPPGESLSIARQDPADSVEDEPSSPESGDDESAGAGDVDRDETDDERAASRPDVEESREQTDGEPGDDDEDDEHRASAEPPRS